MNSSIIQKIAFVASGALFGALGAYYVANKAITEKYETEIKEIEAVSKFYREEYNKAMDDIDKIRRVCAGIGFDFDKAVKVYEKNLKRAEERDDDIAKKSREYIDKNYVSYEKIKPVSETHVEEDEGSEDSDSGDEYELKVEDHTPSKTEEEEDPYLISVDEFSDSHEEYRKVTCTFYTEDDVICETSHNEKIDPRHVGVHNLDVFKNGSYDLLYVRNDYLGVDYEIDKYEGSYAYEVLGEEQLEE